ncbi:ATP-dependent RNA helicase DBP6, putative [Cryptosporidium muris RN66]|uniref:ATP-dependent RNA helicase n=1 Tax=Cryptosporidium muris (strain RN66) TaxID=441375 RepID=B6AE71_CRYMR|nr:ATP-dependent RNA helicase DBP6, putative [Cryptosporidium muris RN66]EEA06512.1 ATP-dependent RNA helicase DBP6, putative [Cryptosporidium muris RN66]|eukprot:XP_002140861.1 ATP-dependent RNA helicase DBP6 [Cryptosporidium muris RN66]
MVTSIPNWTKRWKIVEHLTDEKENNNNDHKDKDILKILHKNIKKGIKSINGFKKFFPIQYKVIPYILKGINKDRNSLYSSDICISVPTGEGKTLCYVIPIINYLQSKSFQHLSSLILVPTRELANQIKNTFIIFSNKYKGPYPIRLMTLTGQSSFSIELQQLNHIIPDIIICTPGRLYEHYYHLCSLENLNNNQIPKIFQYIRFIIIDEIDRLLSQSYNDWLDIINCINKQIYINTNNGELGMGIKKPLLILLSATMANIHYKLNELQLVRPIYFINSTHGESKIPSKIIQKYIKIGENEDKYLILLSLLYELYFSNKNILQYINKTNIINNNKDILLKIIVFCSTKDTAHNLTKYLQYQFNNINKEDILYLNNYKDKDENYFEDNNMEYKNLKELDYNMDMMNTAPLLNIKIEEFSSYLMQKERNRLIKEFSKNKYNILVCSDILSRGIDISDIDIVINYDVPINWKVYIHRIGRTARAGKVGYTFTLVDKYQMNYFKKLIRNNHKFNNPKIQKQYLSIMIKPKLLTNSI